MPFINRTQLLMMLAVIVGTLLAFFPGGFIFLVFALNGISGEVADGATVYAARNEESLRVLEHSMTANLPDRSSISRETHGGVVTLTAGTRVYSLGKRKSRGYPTTKIFVKNGKYRWSILLVPDQYVSSIQFSGVYGYP